MCTLYVTVVNNRAASIFPKSCCIRTITATIKPYNCSFVRLLHCCRVVTWSTKHWPDFQMGIPHIQDAHKAVYCWRFPTNMAVLEAAQHYLYIFLQYFCRATKYPK